MSKHMEAKELNAMSSTQTSVVHVRHRRENTICRTWRDVSANFEIVKRIKAIPLFCLFMPHTYFVFSLHIKKNAARPKKKNRILKKHILIVFMLCDRNLRPLPKAET
jgi:hypothetical protein